MKFAFTEHYRNYLLGCLVLISLATACTRKKELLPDHPSLTQPLIGQLEKAAAKGQLQAGFKQFDNQFAAIKDPGTGDTIAYYNGKIRAYTVYNEHFPNKLPNMGIRTMYYDSIMMVIERNNAQKRYPEDYIEANFQKGDWLYKINQDQNARIFYGRVQLYLKELDDYKTKMQFINRLALVYYKERKFAAAAAAFRQFATQTRSGNPGFDEYYQLQGAWDNAGISYKEIGLMDSALYCYHQNLALTDKFAHLFPDKKGFIADARGVTLNDIGNVYKRLGEYDKAMVYLTESFNLLRNSPDGAEAQSTMDAITQVYLATGRFKQADSVIKREKLSLDTLEGEDIRMYFEKLQADYFNLTGNPKKAAPHTRAYKKMYAEFAKSKHHASENDINDYLSTLQKKYDDERLKSEQESRQLQFVIGMGVVLLVLVVSLLLWHNWRITKRNNAELHEVNQSLKTSLEALQTSQAEESRLLQVVAHDLRSPIGGIQALVTLMQDPVNGMKDNSTMLELIKTAASNCLTLINELLNQRFKKAGMKKDLVNIADVLNYCVNLLKPKAIEKKQELILQPVSNVFAPGSHENLWRVISNLIVNAIKYSGEGASIYINLEERPESIVISVKDPGIGIPEQLRPHIFNMFTDARRSGTAGEQSFGMGLAIAKQIIDAHGGNIWFESEEGAGTTFFVELFRSAQA